MSVIKLVSITFIILLCNYNAIAKGKLRSNKKKVQKTYLHDFNRGQKQNYKFSAHITPRELARHFSYLPDFNNHFFEALVKLIDTKDPYARINELFTSSEIEIRGFPDTVLNGSFLIESKTSSLMLIFHQGSLVIPFGRYKQDLSNRQIDKFLENFWEEIPNTVPPIASELEFFYRKLTSQITVVLDGSFDKSISSKSLNTFRKFCYLNYQAYATLAAAGVQVDRGINHFNHYNNLIEQTLYQLADFHIRFSSHIIQERKELFRPLQFCVAAIQAATYVYHDMNVQVPTRLINQK